MTPKKQLTTAIRVYLEDQLRSVQQHENDYYAKRILEGMKSGHCSAEDVFDMNLFVLWHGYRSAVHAITKSLIEDGGEIHDAIEAAFEAVPPATSQEAHNGH